MEDIHSFTYLGSIVTSDGGVDEDVKSRRGKARQAFNILRPAWKLTTSTKTKLRIFTIFGSETLRVTRSKLQTFINQRLRKILKIYWPEKISSRELWARTGRECLPAEIARRKWN